jgi:hypothetical protein
MSIELSAERAIELLREVVAEYGEDHVYTTQEGQRANEGPCLYVHGDQPGCIAGHVYHRAGLTLDQLRAQEGSTARGLGFIDLGVSADVADLLSRAQDRQDKGYTWGEALAAAIEAAEEGGE